MFASLSWITFHPYFVSLFHPHSSLSTSKSQLALNRVRGVVVDGSRVVLVLIGAERIIFNDEVCYDSVIYLVLREEQYHQWQYQMIGRRQFDW